MNDKSERVEEFKAELDELNVGVPSLENERWMLVAGIVLVVVGAVLVFAGWWGASGTGTLAEQFPYFISGGVGGLACIVVGSVLFARYSMTRYLRYWLIRIVYEQQAQTDRTVEAIGRVEDALTSRVPKAKD